MIDYKRFFAARALVLSESVTEDGIGTLGEKTLHKILKFYIEPDLGCHEVRYLSVIADVKNDEGVFEIQTRNFERLVPKLKKLLPHSRVTVVCPVIRSKTLRWIDKSSGEISEPRKSPKVETECDAFRNLYRIKEFINNENLRVRLLFLEAEEFKYLDGWDKSGKRGSTRAERIPTALLESVDINSSSEYAAFFPKSLGEKFTAMEFSKAIKRTPRYSYNVLRFFLFVGAIEHIENRGRAFVYKKKD